MKADFDRFLKRLKNKEKYDLVFLKEAFDFAKSVHGGQKRESGEDFFIHPFNVALITASLNLDQYSIAAALLHDVVEDSKVTLLDIKEKFGPAPASLVEGLTKVAKVAAFTSYKGQAENLRKLLIATGSDLRVILIKLADRLHNMRTLEHLPEADRIRISKETLLIYAPLAHRLGMENIRQELEDLAFSYINPDEFLTLTAQVNSLRANRKAVLNEYDRKISEALNALNIKHTIGSRAKNIYGIYKKMKKDGKSFAEIYDVMGVRILVESEKDCYNALGAVHNIFTPLPGRFKDYIALPKENMYQSLHTTVLTGASSPLEIQIRTYGMDKVADEGVAAHWLYKTDKTHTKKEMKKHFDWYKSLAETLNEISDPAEALQFVRGELKEEKVYALTPAGDVKELIRGATVLDFAYLIHTSVGHRFKGAKVNGKIAPITHKVKSGEVIEILTSKEESPSADWLKVVKTQSVRYEIKRFFKDKNIDIFEAQGRQKFLKELEANRLTLSDIEDELNKYLKKESFVSLNVFYAKIGEGALRADTFFKGYFAKNQKADVRVLSGDTATKKQMLSTADTVTALARCCMPVYGDAIAGYISHGKGITIHKTNCKNFFYLKKKTPKRIITVNWPESSKEHYMKKITISSEERKSILADILNIISTHSINIKSVNASSLNNRSALHKIVVFIKNKEELDALKTALEKIKGVYTVTV